MLDNRKRTVIRSLIVLTILLAVPFLYAKINNKALPYEYCGTSFRGYKECMWGTRCERPKILQPISAEGTCTPNLRQQIKQEIIRMSTENNPY